jgi:hypothetical protein
MGRLVGVVLCVAALAIVVTVIDLQFLRDRIWERLMLHIAAASMFAAFYFRVLRHR